MSFPGCRLSFMNTWIGRQPTEKTHFRMQMTLKCTRFILFWIQENASKTWTIRESINEWTQDVPLTLEKACKCGLRATNYVFGEGEMDWFMKIGQVLLRVHVAWFLTLFSYDLSSEICCLRSFRTTLLGSLTSRYLMRCFIDSIRDTDFSFSLIIFYLSEIMYFLIKECFWLHLS